MAERILGLSAELERLLAEFVSSVSDPGASDRAA